MKLSTLEVMGLTAFGALLGPLPFTAAKAGPTDFFQDYEVSQEHLFGRLNPSAPEGTSQYAFMIGSWTCDERIRRGGEWAPFKSFVKGYYFLNGFGIINTTYTGDAVSLMTYEYNPATKTWIITNSNAPEYRHSIWEGVKEGDTMLARTETTAPNGKSATLHITFYDIEADSFQWKLEAQTPGGPFLIREKTCERKN